MTQNVFSLLEMMLDQKIIVIDGMHPVKGAASKVPFGLFFQKIANSVELFDQITGWIQEEIPESATYIGGLGYEGILIGHCIAKNTGRKFFAVERSTSNGKLAGFNVNLPLNGENIAIVTGIIGTGTNTAEGLNLINGAGGMCNSVHTIFDYNFNLRYELAVVQDLNINAIFTSNSLKDYFENKLSSHALHPIKQWHKESQNFFRRERKVAAILN
jgi:orotate phosphoribosyltransferase